MKVTFYDKRHLKKAVEYNNQNKDNSSNYVNNNNSSQKFRQILNVLNNFDDHLYQCIFQDKNYKKVSVYIIVSK